MFSRKKHPKCSLNPLKIKAKKSVSLKVLYNINTSEESERNLALLPKNIPQFLGIKKWLCSHYLRAKLVTR